MTLLNTTNAIEGELECKIDGSNSTIILKNISSHRDGIYIFRDPLEGSENDKFIIIYSGNRTMTSDNMVSEIFHYVLLKEGEKSNYLIDKGLFDILFKKITKNGSLKSINQ